MAGKSGRFGGFSLAQGGLTRWQVRSTLYRALKPASAFPKKSIPTPGAGRPGPRAVFVL